MISILHDSKFAFLKFRFVSCILLSYIKLITANLHFTMRSKIIQVFWEEKKNLLRKRSRQLRLLRYFR